MKPFVDSLYQVLLRDSWYELLTIFTSSEAHILGSPSFAGAATAGLVKRWPVIITSIIDNIYRRNHYLFTGPENDSHVDRITNGKELISKLAELKYGMAHDKALIEIPDDGGLDVPIYNRELGHLEEENNHTWFTAPWLFAE